MRVSKITALAFLAITVAEFSTRVGSAQTPDLECAQLSNVPDDGASLAAGLKVSASKKIDPSQAESACRSALRADPVNPTFMFLLGRALSLGNKRLEAIKYYLDAVDRGHAGAMNDLGGVFQYGVGDEQSWNALSQWYRSAKGPQPCQELV
jgi:TPR repeat protein